MTAITVPLPINVSINVVPTVSSKVTVLPPSNVLINVGHVPVIIIEEEKGYGANPYGFGPYGGTTATTMEAATWL